MASNSLSKTTLQNQQNFQIKWDKIFAKDVLIPKVVNTSPLERYGVMTFFDCQKWRCLLVDGKPIYPLLVKQFYAYLSFSHASHTVRSFVNGKDITLDEFTLSKILNIPYDGWGIESLSRWCLSPISPIEQTRIVMFDDSIPSHYIPFFDQLPPISKVIHQLCFHNIFPRDSQYYKLTEQDMFFISMMLSQKPVNLPGAILSYMNRVVQKDLSLPYGGILTNVFEYFNVDLECTEYVSRTPYPSSALDKLNLTFLEQQMPDISKGNQPTELIETMTGQEVNPSSNAILENLQSPIIPQITQSSNVLTLEGIYSMVQENNSRLGNIESRVANIESQLLFLQEQQTQFSQTLSTLITFLTSSFPPS